MNHFSGKLKYGKGQDSDTGSAFAVVKQQPFVFHNTLKYNLTLGKEVADNKLFEVLKSVGLNHLADKSGLLIKLGSGTHQLSGLDYENADRLNRLIIEYPGTVINIEHQLSKEITNRFNKKLRLNQL